MLEEDINSEIENYGEEQYIDSQVEYFEEDDSEDFFDARQDNRGKPIGFRCWHPKFKKRVHNTVLVSYIDHGRGYYCSHVGSYTNGPKYGHLSFHTLKDYQQIKNPKPSDWVYYVRKIHPGLKPHQKGFWYAFYEGSSKAVQVHNGIFDYVTIKSNPGKRIYNIQEARAHRGEIANLHYTHYILNPANPNDIVYRPHDTAPNERVIDLGLLPTK